MGMPAYLGYYITHSWESSGSYLSIAPHKDSVKPALELATLPDKAIEVVMARENVENGEAIANMMSLLVLLLAVIIWTYSMYE